MVALSSSPLTPDNVIASLRCLQSRDVVLQPRSPAKRRGQLRHLRPTNCRPVSHSGGRTMSWETSCSSSTPSICHFSPRATIDSVPELNRPRGRAKIVTFPTTFPRFGRDSTCLRQCSLPLPFSPSHPLRLSAEDCCGIASLRGTDRYSIIDCPFVPQS